jgi:hypothetical protein
LVFIASSGEFSLINHPRGNADEMETGGGARMTTTWTTAVEQAADVLGEMLVEMASEGTEYTHEEIAAAALATGLKALLGDEPGAKRVEHAARVIYEKLHDADKPTWEAINAIERDFWLDIARAAVRASDAGLLQETEA